MPYFKLPNQRKYEYEPAIGELKFTRENLNTDSRQIFDVLREIGVKTVYCRYNGGHDEGFADFTGAKVEDRIVEFEELKSLLAETSLVSEASIDLSRYYGDYNRYPEVSPRQRVVFCLDVFACALATHLLGSGYVKS
ncbi:hypothetical protein Riv7116_6479 [Rivularia sp. PCC 7116]|uniref:hypothetical protein n=1 Tax=Rivularia sp. PCC 7116 TaxID=373994 RepID=UPI00029F0B67|nr:hypothetical protein [Rivularia sp. PCC 7116]AFY58808.1 hypothetical protein Riv7116_6479 [Rivularia sp. PCC 7116]